MVVIRLLYGSWASNHLVSSSWDRSRVPFILSLSLMHCYILSLSWAALPYSRRFQIAEQMSRREISVFLSCNARRRMKGGESHLVLHDSRISKQKKKRKKCSFRRLIFRGSDRFHALSVLFFRLRKGRKRRLFFLPRDVFRSINQRCPIPLLHVGADSAFVPNFSFHLN